MGATAARLDEAMRLRGYDQSRLARELEVAQGSISKIILGKTANSRLMPRIATKLGVPLAWLLGMSDDIDDFPAPPRSLAIAANYDDDEADDDDTVEISALNVGFGMGGTFIEDHTVVSDKMKISRRLLQAYTQAPPDMLFVAQGFGDSMSPTINDTDFVLVDRTETRIQHVDKIWAVAFGEFGMIKRLRPKPDGTIVILSDNPQVPDDVATDGELYIVGRVAAILRKV